MRPTQWWQAVKVQNLSTQEHEIVRGGGQVSKAGHVYKFPSPPSTPCQDLLSIIHSPAQVPAGLRPFSPSSYRLRESEGSLSDTQALWWYIGDGLLLAGGESYQRPNSSNLWHSFNKRRHHFTLLLLIIWYRSSNIPVAYTIINFSHSFGQQWKTFVGGG